MTHTENTSVSEGEKISEESSQSNKTTFDGQLNITVRTIDSDSYPVAIAHSETVSKLKEQLEDVAGVTRERQRLIFQGRVMKDEKTLHECGLKTGNVIHLVIRPLEALGNNDEPQPPHSSTTRHRNIMSPSGFMVSTISLEPESSPINNIFSSIFGGSPRNSQASPLSTTATPTSIHTHTPRSSTSRPNGTPNEPRSSSLAHRQTTDNGALFNRASTHLRRLQDLWDLTPEHEIQGNDVVRAGQLMWEFSNALEHLTGVLRPLARTFMDESSMTDPQERTRVQEETASVARGMYRLTQLESAMATILHRTRMTPTDSFTNDSSPSVPPPSETSGSEATSGTNQSQTTSTPNQRLRTLNPFFSSPSMTFSVYPDISLQIETSSGTTIPISVPMTPASNQQPRERNQEDSATRGTPETQTPQQQPANAEESNPQASNPLSSLLSSLFSGSPGNTLGSPFTTILPSRSSGGSSSFIASTTIPFVSIIPSSRIGQARSTANPENSTNPSHTSGSTTANNAGNSTSSQTIPTSNTSRPETNRLYDLGVLGTTLSNYLTLLEESQGRSNVSVAEALRLEPSSTNNAQNFVYQFFHSILVSEAHEIIRGHPSSLQQLHTRLTEFFQANISTDNRSEDIMNLAQSLSDHLVNHLHLSEALPNNDTIIESLQDRLKRYLAKQFERLLRFLLDVQPKRRANESNPSMSTTFIPNWVREVVQEVRNDFFNAYGNDRTREIVHLVVKHHFQSLCNLLSLSATRFMNELESTLLTNEAGQVSEGSTTQRNHDDEHNAGESSTGHSAKRRKYSDS
ncbi:hypothetical protein K7432_002494 [Basidiobolus ranarum]|uniref:Ubiquitin-like domain-containing protein n=1 Tax=Basidiobolus ranarum TaxID=34480 RepID=A0ABR2X1E5_9FUNG